MSSPDADAHAGLHRPGEPGYRRLNGAMALAGLAAFGVMYATQPLLPAIAADVGTSPTGASLTVSATTGALAVLVLPATALGARLGRVTAVRAGLVLAVLLTLACAVAPSFGALLVLRGLTGAALALVVALAMGHVAAEVHPRGLASAMGLYVAGNSLGGVSGRLVTSAVLDVASWRVALAVLAAAAALAVAAFWWLLPAPVAVRAEPGEAHGVLGVRPPALLASLALLVVPFALMGAFVAAYNYLTFRLEAPPFALPAAVVGLVFLAYLAGGAASAAAGRLADAVGRTWVLVGSTVVMAGGVALTLPDHLAAVVAGTVVLTVGFFGAHSVASGWAPVLDPEPAGRAGAFYVMAYYAGSSVFGALIGTAWRAGGWPATALALEALVGVGLAAALVVGWLRRHAARERRAERAAERHHSAAA